MVTVIIVIVTIVIVTTVIVTIVIFTIVIVIIVIANSYYNYFLVYLIVYYKLYSNRGILMKTTVFNCCLNNG